MLKPKKIALSPEQVHMILPENLRRCNYLMRMITVTIFTQMSSKPKNNSKITKTATTMILN